MREIRLLGTGPVCPECKIPTFPTRLVFSSRKEPSLRWICLKCGYSQPKENIRVR